MSYSFRPAKTFTEQHGVFVGVVGDTNSGKSWSSMRLAQGIASSQGKRVAALDTEGGRLLHLKDHFDFDIMIMGPPHRPERYLQAAQHAEAQGYGALQMDSFSQVWRGIGGVLDWTDTNISTMVENRRATAKEKGWRFDEAKERAKLKSAASIEPQMSHAMMVNGFLGLRIPIIFAIRGGMTFDPKINQEKFKAQCKPTFPFELTISFRLAADRKGYIDLSDPASWKMEGAHQSIFRDGDRLSEEHGAKLAAWARGEVAEPSGSVVPINSMRAVAQQVQQHAPGPSEAEDDQGDIGEPQPPAAVVQWVDKTCLALRTIGAEKFAAWEANPDQIEKRERLDENYPALSAQLKAGIAIARARLFPDAAEHADADVGAAA